MQIEVVARGFPLTDALRQAVEREARTLARGLAARVRRVSVRLYDVNGRRGGDDKVCLVQAQLGSGAMLIGTDIDADLYHAITRAFLKVENGARRTLGRMRSRRRRDDGREPAPSGFAVV